MKTYLALISFGILSLQSFATAAEEMIKYPQLLRSADVKIPQAYTPFGNRLEFNKFGDDGSSCVLDANGVLTWIDNTGAVRVLPNSDLAVPLYVTATECLVWNNRFVDYTSYTSRPNAVLKLYRAAVGSTVLTEVTLPAIAAKEILDTPPVTNTTSPLTFVTAMRKDNGAETEVATSDGKGGTILTQYNLSDDCELRVYRLTAGTGVQFLKSYNRQVKYAVDFATNSSGPNVSVIGYGSDGSVALEIADDFTGGWTTDPDTKIATPKLKDKILWLDDQGRSVDVLTNALVTGTAPPVVKILSTTKTRLVYQVTGNYAYPNQVAGAYVTDDSTLNVALSDGNGIGIGITPAPASSNTTSGELQTAQVETATAAGTITANGTADVVVTANGLSGSPKKFLVAVTSGDTPKVWAGKVRLALAADSAVSSLFDVSGSDASIVLTRKALATYDLRRNSTTGALAGTAILRILPTATTGNVAGYTQTDAAGIDFSNYSRVGDNKYFYTVGKLVGDGSLNGTSVISTYQIAATDPTLVSWAAPGIMISSSALVGTVNPADGSALIKDEDGDFLIWLHKGIGYDGSNKLLPPVVTAGYSALPTSSQAKALYVTEEQAVIWENADVLKNANGTIPDAIVKHYARDTTTGLLTPSSLALDGATLLNTPRLTPVPDYWLLTTAKKPQADTSTLRTYALRTAKNIDTDGDGLTNYYETTVSLTDPNKFDTDGDGLSDGEEIANGSNPNDPTSVSDHTLTLDNGGVATGGTFSKTSGSLAHGASATFTAVPASGYVFQAWTGDLSGSTNPSTLLMNSNKAVGATFVPDTRDSDDDGLTNYDELVTYHTNPNDAASVPTYTLTLANGGVVTGGTFSKTSGSLAHGTNATLTAVPAAGYVLQAWTGDLSGWAPTQTLLMNGNKTVGATFVADTRIPPSNIPNFLRQTDVTISQAYAPFGNRLEFNRFGDDGSSCVLDANGVLTWIDSLGTVHVLPDTDKAIPLFVTNTECLVWSNRFVDYDTYEKRPTAVLTLYRSTPGSTTVTSSFVSSEFFGKEVLATAPVTTTTGTLTFVTSNRVDNGKETTYPVGLGTADVNLNDVVDLRVYRLTVNGGVQFLKTLSGLTKNAGDFETAVASPNVTTLGSGSDGSLVVLNQEAFVDNNGAVGIYEPRGYWIDSDGRDLLLDGAVAKVLYTSNTRLIYEDTTGSVYERRRSSNTGALIFSASQTLTVLGKSLDLSNYTKSGNNQFFFTLDTDLTTVRTYQVSEAAVALVSTSTLPSQISYAAQAGSVNPADGSAMLYSENGVGVFWLNSSGVTTLPSSTLAKPLYVTDTQAVIWENAHAPVDGAGKIPPAVVISYTRDLITRVVTPTRIYLDGTTLLNTLSLTPDFPYWVLSTAEKTGDATARLRTYRLASAETSDKDNDGILDQYETNTGTFVSMTDTGTNPNDPDTDGDGRRDGNEVYPFAVIRGNFTWQEAADHAVATGGHLATLTSAAERNGLIQRVRGLLNYSVWLGATDSASENNFKWVTGEALDSAVSQWAPGKPDNAQNADGLVLRPNSQWADAPQSEKLSYVIEYPSSNPMKIDTDGDTLSDAEDIAFKSDPNKMDTDGDGLNDNLERDYGNNPQVADIDADTDGDLLSNVEERTGIMRPGSPSNPNHYKTNPTAVDSDGDGVSDHEELVRGSNPLDDFRMHDRVKAEGSPVDVTIPATFAPFGNRTNFNRYGDDGSAMLVDVNGVVLWQDAQGAVRRVENSEQATPLVVSDSEAIVWTNAFADYENYIFKPNVAVSIYRKDAVTGLISSTPTSVPLLGKEIVATAPITSTTEAYTIVTSEHGLDFNVSGFVDGDTLYRIYRVTYSGQVQRIGQVEVYGTGSANAAVSMTVAMGHGSDGSLVFSQEGIVDTDPSLSVYYENYRRIFWVDGTRAGSSGIWEELSNGDYGQYVANATASTKFSRVVSTSKTRVVYEKYVDGKPKLFEARRNKFTGALSNDFIPVAADVPYARLLQMSTQTKEGDNRWLYALSEAQDQIIVYLLKNTGVEKQYVAKLPGSLSLDETATVEKINSIDGSAVITADNIDNLLWVRNAGADDKNVTRIPDSRLAQPIFVHSAELLLWGNAYQAVPDSGKLNRVSIRHYEQKNGVLVNPTNAYTDISSFIQGNFVLSTPPFTRSYPTWKLSIVEKIDATTARIRSYSMQEVDSDRDGLADSEEVNVYLTDPNDEDSDKDGYKDGYEVINGSNPKDVASFPSYTLTLANAGAATGGTFSKTLGSLAHDKTATLTAAPATGYVLQAWTVDLSGSTLTKTLLMNGNKTVGATFVPDTHDSDGDGLSNYDELVTYHTDPNNADGDGDGLSDGTEIKNIGSDPNNQNDVLRPSGLPFTNYKVAKGDYWGLVYDPAAGVLSSLKLTLAAKGSFSATLLGYPALKGAFSAGVCNMAYSGADMASVSMTLQQLDGGCAMVGSFSDVMGKRLSFVLRRAVTYRKCNLTFAASPIDAAAAPTGSAVATGAIAKGKVSFMVYLPNGGVQSFSGAVVGGNRIPLFTGGGGLAGELSLRSIPGSDFDGKVNFQGYNQLRNLTGSCYVTRSKKDLPLYFDTLKNKSNNTLFQWSGGSFNGSQLVGTWTPKTLALSTTSSQQANATLNAKTGLMGVNYYNGSAWSTGKAVVLQASNAAKGFYTNGPDGGSLVIQPNFSNTAPAAGASLSGYSYSGSKAAVTVPVTVYAAGAWNVDLKGVSWVTASTSSGSGNGTVTLTLAANATGTADRKNRSATISIAGQNYTISQTWD